MAPSNVRRGWNVLTPRPTGSRSRPPHGVRRTRGKGTERRRSGETTRNWRLPEDRAGAVVPCAGDAKTGRLGARERQGCGTDSRRSAGRGEGQDGLRSEWAMPERGPAGRVMTPGTPSTRRRWNGAASGMLAVALEALGADHRALGCNPRGGNGLDGLWAARALRPVRTARGYDGAVLDSRSWHPQIADLNIRAPLRPLESGTRAALLLLTSV